jgi:hypothetical protein
MNVSDLRNMQAGQGVFWAAALPLTSFIVVLTLIIAFKRTRLMQIWTRLTTKNPVKINGGSIGKRHPILEMSIFEVLHEQGGLHACFLIT